MSTVSRSLPQSPHLDVPKREARELLREIRSGVPAAFDRIRRRHPRHHDTSNEALAAAGLKLSDAQLVLAREYGFSNWTELKARIDAQTPAGLLDQAIRANDLEGIARLLRAYPEMLHLPVCNGNWGPPMSHAANLGRLEAIELIASLGARDYQHAFDRALLQGRLECAKWLHEHGAELRPGIVMGCCETLNAAGLGFLDALDAPFTDQKGNPLAPLGLVLETYGRNPTGKRAVLEIFARRGCRFPDSPMMAFHRGDVARLKEHLRREPGLLERRFAYREIYPLELGCRESEITGLHGSPIGGTTLLHLAIDFDEQEIFDWLIEAGADVNARALVDAAGFGGHTPLFNGVISCAYLNGRQRDALMTQALLKHGASPTARASLRKFLDWCETPGWHEARNVTPAEWARGFPEQSWPNPEALRLIESATT